jgi:hypothetical protein
MRWRKTSDTSVVTYTPENNAAAIYAFNVQCLGG